MTPHQHKRGPVPIVRLGSLDGQCGQIKGFLTLIGALLERAQCAAWPLAPHGSCGHMRSHARNAGRAPKPVTGDGSVTNGQACALLGVVSRRADAPPQQSARGGREGAAPASSLPHIAHKVPIVAHFGTVKGELCGPRQGLCSAGVDRRVGFPPADRAGRPRGAGRHRCPTLPLIAPKVPFLAHFGTVKSELCGPRQGLYRAGVGRGAALPPPPEAPNRPRHRRHSPLQCAIATEAQLGGIWGLFRNGLGQRGGNALNALNLAVRPKCIRSIA